MKNRFHRPQSLAEALELLGELGDAAWPIAGGTDLTLQIRMGRREPRQLVGLTDVGLDTISEEDGALVVGATATLKAIIAHPVVRRELPSLASACAQIGGPPIQTVATLGGNLGNASPAADSVPPLFVEDALVRLASAKDGTRDVPLRDWFIGPGRTVRRADELITAVVVPLPPTAGEGPGSGPRVSRTFRKYGPRRANVISAVTFAARLALAKPDGASAGAPSESGEIVVDARIALGSVAPTPVRAAKTEAWLTGKPLTPALLRDDGLATTVAADVRPITDVRGSERYKTTLALNSVRFALNNAFDEARQGVTR